MKLSDQEKNLLGHILDARITELKAKPVFYTGRTPREIVVAEQQELWDTQELKTKLMGD